jgi:hypothetical protein
MKKPQAVASVEPRGRHYDSRSTASSYLPEPMPVSAKMPWSAIHLKVSSQTSFGAGIDIYMSRIYVLTYE